MSGFVLDGLAGREGSMRTYAASALGYERQSPGSNRSGRYCWIGTNQAAQQRRRGEHHQADQENPPASDQVPEPPDEQ